MGLVKKELGYIRQLNYESYFLTVHDVVRYARTQGILCQGRGFAANSTPCYCLGVTAVDPTRFQLVFERFASGERVEPPDIDIDFEHERREEVIQYVYQKYGRDRAAMPIANRLPWSLGGAGCRQSPRMATHRPIRQMAI
jgi:error-prone DNA polymerase